MISEYIVRGAHTLPSLEVERAVYPFCGPNRTAADISGACRALEKAYHDRHYGAATVEFVPPVGSKGVVTLQVSEGVVERLDVKGARYFSPNAVKNEAPSMREGEVLNFDDVTRDVQALNQLPDRTVTPVLQPGSQPGTYDIDLNVKDSSPVHGSADVNDYRTPNTTPLRVTASVSDSNLWQAGHGIGVSLEEAPDRPKDSEVFTGYYLLRFAGAPGFSVTAQFTKQDSDVSTLGGATVAGPGRTAELRLSWLLPNGTDWSSGEAWKGFSHSLYLAADYKHFQQAISTPSSGSGATEAQASTIVTPITYYPFSAGYSAYLQGLTGKNSTTDLNASVSFHLRGMGSGPAVFDLNRFGSDGGYTVVRASLDHTSDLPGGFQAFGRIQGQIANQPLVSSEEMSGGGESSARGYLESEDVGDNGVFGTIELRSPPLTGSIGKNARDWRLYVFCDGGRLTLLDPLPEQQDAFDLASVGFGSRLSLGDHLNGGFDAGYPLTSDTYTTAHELRMTFHVGASF